MIYIILPVYNRKQITELFINSLMAQTYKDYKLILVDDGSTDGTSEMVLNFLPQSIVIKGDGNLWWAGSLHKGYEWLRNNNVNGNDIVLFINDDTEFEDNFLDTAIHLLDNSERTLLKSWSIDKYSKVKADGYIDANIKKLTFKNTMDESKANCSSTRGLFLKVEDLFFIGDFVPEKLPHYLSDYEFTIRAVNKGCKIACNDKLYLYSDSSETGYHEIKYNDFKEFVSKYFSNKNPGNPKHWINFINMTAHNKKIAIYNILKIIYSSSKQIFKALLKRSSK